MLERRQFLRGAVAAPVTAGVALPLLAASDPDRALTGLVDELFSLDRRIGALVSRHPGLDCDDMPGYPALNARWFEVVEAIVETKATTLQGLRIKAHALESGDLDGCGCLSGDVARSVAEDVLAIISPGRIGGSA